MADAIPTPWSCWLHPRRTSRWIAKELASRGREAEAAVESLRLEATRLSADNTRLAASLAERERECGEMRKELGEKRDDDLFQEETERKLAELEEMMGKAMEMKQNYEERISKLKSHLRELRQELRDLKAPPSSAAPIDMDPLRSSRTSRTKPQSMWVSDPSESLSPRVSDPRPTLQTLWVDGTSEESVPPAEPQPPQPKTDTTGDDDLDWLQSLPDNI